MRIFVAFAERTLYENISIIDSYYQKSLSIDFKL